MSYCVHLTNASVLAQLMGPFAVGDSWLPGPSMQLLFQVETAALLPGMGSQGKKQLGKVDAFGVPWTSAWLTDFILSIG